MTQPAQQPEYIITEEQLKKYEGLFFLDDDALDDFKKIRSRPASTPTPETCETCEWMIRADEREKRDAAIRNQTLDDVKEIVNTYYSACPKLKCVEIVNMAEDIESLRSPAQQPAGDE